MMATTVVFQESPIGPRSQVLNTMIEERLAGQAASVAAGEAKDEAIAAKDDAVTAREEAEAQRVLSQAAAEDAEAFKIAASGSASAAAANRALTDADVVAAEAARDAAFSNANVYANTATGLANTTIGDQFQVIEAEYAIRYKHEAGPTATEVARYPTKDAIDAESERITAAETTQRITYPSRSPVASDYHAPMFDTVGRMAFGIDNDGDVNIGSMKVHLGAMDRSGRLFDWFVGDMDSRVAIGVDRWGATWIDEIVVDQSRDRSGSPFFWSISDAGVNAALGVRRDGVVEIGELVRGDYTAPADWSPDYEVANVRRYRGFDVALRLDGSFAYDVRRNTSSTTAVIQAAAPMILAPMYGQSNAGEGGNEGDPLILDALFPTAVFSFPVAFTSYGTSLFDAGRMIGMKPLQQTTGLQNDMAGPTMAFGLEHAWREASGRASPGVFSWTSWEGGVAITEFERGTNNWDNLLAGITAAVPAAAAYGRTLQCPAITFVQGESGPTSGYQALLEALADDLCVEVQTVLSLASAPKLLIAQINCNDDALVAESKSGVRLDQLAAAQAAGRIVMAGPMYQCPMVDNVHSTNEGRMVFGEMLAEAHRVLHQTGEWVPLWPTGAVRSGANIDITFAVPFGDLQFDADWVADVVNKGFSYSDSTTSATISSVTITGPNTVRVALSGIPSGASKTISYAIWSDSADDGWAAGRGLLYSESTTASLFHRMGHAVPSHIRHYCVAFEIGDL